MTDDLILLPHTPSKRYKTSPPPTYVSQAKEANIGPNPYLYRKGSLFFYELLNGEKVPIEGVNYTIQSSGGATILEGITGSDGTVSWGPKDKIGSDEAVNLSYVSPNKRFSQQQILASLDCEREVEIDRSAVNTIRIGLFFDGTDNHMERDRNSADKNSALTNVAKLHDLYDTDEATYAIYVQGVGTITEKDLNPVSETLRSSLVTPVTTTLGLAFGTGPEGGHARIKEAKEKIDNTLVEAKQRHGEIITVQFDIFGFSRGAALARHFVNVLMEEGGEWKEKVEVTFLGVFDTVGSFYLPGNDKEGSFNLHIHPDAVEEAYHITAENEFRENFPLTTLVDTRSSPPSNFKEESLLGAHSDIGGGYAPYFRVENGKIVEIAGGGYGEAYKFGLPFKDGEYNYEEVLIAQQNDVKHNNLKAQQQALIQRYPEAIIKTNNTGAGDTSRGEIYYQINVTQRLKPRPDLAHVALHKMYKHAFDKKLPLKGMDLTDSLFVDVEENKIKKELLYQEYIHRPAKSRNIVWENQPITQIKTGFNTSIGMTPESDLKRKVFVNRPLDGKTKR